jgi:dTDP-4-amino-4,6-dideoxygalactose transaminase
LMRLRPDCRVADLFLRLRGEYDGLYLRPMRTADVLARGWEELHQRLESRYRNAEAYEQVLSGGPWSVLAGWRTSGVCWRFSLLVDFPEWVIPFCESVRYDGFHVSNLYWPVHDFFRPEDKSPNARAFARRVVNLWTDSTVTVDAAKKCATSLLTHAERFTRVSCREEKGYR